MGLLYSSSVPSLFLTETDTFSTEAEPCRLASCTNEGKTGVTVVVEQNVSELCRLRPWGSARITLAPRSGSTKARVVPRSRKAQWQALPQLFHGQPLHAGRWADDLPTFWGLRDRLRRGSGHAERHLCVIIFSFVNRAHCCHLCSEVVPLFSLLFLRVGGAGCDLRKGLQTIRWSSVSRFGWLQTHINVHVIRDGGRPVIDGRSEGWGWALGGSSEGGVQLSATCPKSMFMYSPGLFGSEGRGCSFMLGNVRNVSRERRVGRLILCRRMRLSVQLSLRGDGDAVLTDSSIILWLWGFMTTYWSLSASFSICWGLWQRGKELNEWSCRRQGDCSIPTGLR